MAQLWPYEKIRELIALARINGESRALLASEREASLFRQAIYSYRKQNNDGYDIAVTIDDKTVIVTRKPTVTILQEEQETTP